MGMPEKTFKKAKLVTQNKLWQILNIIYPFSHEYPNFMYQSIQNYPPPPPRPRAYPRHLTGNLTQNVPPPPPTQVRHLTFMPKHWSASEAKGFSLFWLCLVDYLHLNKQFDAWENFWIVGEGFDTFWSTSWYIWGLLIWPSKLPKYQEFHQNFGKKVKCPGGGGVAWGGVCHGQF